MIKKNIKSFKFKTDKGVLIVGDSNLPSTMPFDASKMYGKNVLNFLQLIIDKEGNLNLNFEILMFSLSFLNTNKWRLIKYLKLLLIHCHH